MPSSISRHASGSSGAPSTALWAAALAGPVAWFALLETNYVLSYEACVQHHTWMLHLAAGFALALTAAGIGRCRAAMRTTHDSETSGMTTSRFLAVGGSTLGALFALVILATEIPVVVLQPCS